MVTVTTDQESYLPHEAAVNGVHGVVRVTDAAGNPIAGAAVSLLNAHLVAGRHAGATEYRGVTDSEGSFRFEPSAAYRTYGEYSLSGAVVAGDRFVPATGGYAIGVERLLDTLP